MNNDAFNALIDLVDFDQKTLSLQNSISKLASEVSVFEKRKFDLDAQIEQIKNFFHDTQKEVDLGELEIKTYEQQIKDKKKRIDETSNQKEYIAFKREIEQLTQKQHECEAPLVEAWNRLEQAKQDFKKHEENYEKSLEKINEEEKSVESQIENLKKELEEHLKVREERVKVVPKEWLEKYEVLGSRVPDPVVPVESGSCSACFYDITPQVMLELKHGKLMQCKGCYRFLYIKKEQ